MGLTCILAEVDVTGLEEDLDAVQRGYHRFRLGPYQLNPSKGQDIPHNQLYHRRHR